MCQPKLSVDRFDLESARKLAKMLKQDSDFYEECSKDAINNHDRLFSESTFLEHMKKVLQ
jgi:hypothetical protein